MSAEHSSRIHLANAALVTSPHIWPGVITAGHNTLGEIAQEIGVCIQAHPIRTVGTLVEQFSPGKAVIKSGHQGFRGEKYPWQAINRDYKKMAIASVVYAFHHYGPPSLRHIKRYQEAMGGAPLPTTVYSNEKVRADQTLGQQTIQVSRADMQGIGLLSGDYDPLTPEKLDYFLRYLHDRGYHACIDTLHTYKLVKGSSMDWQATIEYLLNKQQICEIGEVHTSAGQRDDFTGDISPGDLEKFYRTLKTSAFNGHITIETPLHVLAKRVRRNGIPSLYQPIVQQIRALAI